MADSSRRFSFAFTSARVMYDSVGHSFVTGPDGIRQDVTGIGTLIFNDGTIQERDGAPLVDDLFYYSRNLDVWAAHIQDGTDADTHYALYGWREGRNPNEFFSTASYLTAHPEARTSGLDPVAHYDQVGWKSGYDPGPDFSTFGYLAANPDIRAANIDPLKHFLEYGVSEGRVILPSAPYQSGIAPDGLDYSFYLTANPDVRAANVNGDLHYSLYGWQEGRNPNAYFDTRGYLATYTDVAAANTGPLRHYHLYGYQEGRDPGPAFDTKAYLAANPDIAAAHIDPLEHFLRYGAQEGRVAIAKPLYDTDAAADAVAEGAATGTAVGATFSWGGWISPNLTYAISADGSGGGFKIDASTGKITVADGARLDYETSGASHAYTVTVTARDGGFSISKTLTIAVGDVNDNAPLITSGASGSVAENAPVSTVVYTATATDADATAPNNQVRFSLSGTDAAQFDINATTGAVTFKASPNFEAPTDAGGNNVYDIVVVATDGGNPALSSSKAVAITVTDVNEFAPVITSGAAATTPENVSTTTAVYTATATDGDGSAPNKTVTYSLASGGDSGLFDINATTGAVTFKASPNFEAPADAGANNVYDITVVATDGGNPALSSSKAVAITVTDVNEFAPVITSGAAATTLENVSTTTAVYTAQATDGDGSAPNKTVTYSLASGGDNGLFDINATTGAVTFKASPDHEAPADAGGNNVYDIVVVATDGGNPALTSSKAVAITVTDVNDTAPVFTSSATPSVAENTTAVVTLTATDADTVGINPPTFSIVGGVDAAQFQIVGGNQLRFINAKDYETQAHSYAVQVSANDGVNQTIQSLTVTLTDANDNAPVITSGATATAPEGTATTTTVYTAIATDADATAPNKTVSYSLAAGGDNDLFAIDATSGAVTFRTSPNFESPADAGGNNVYDITVVATDGGNPALTSSKAVAITVTDVAPSTPTDGDGAIANSVTEGAAAGTYTGLTASSSDVNGGTVSYSLTNSAGGRFDIGSDGRVLVTAFGAANIDYETAPGHAYSVTVQASDGTLTTSQTFTIGVANAPPSVPVDANGAVNQVSNGAPQGSPTGLTAASDDPNGGTVTYSLTNNDGGHFQIDPNTGVVTVGATAPMYDSGTPANNTRTITVQAADAAGAFTTADFTIAVNPNAPPVNTVPGAQTTAEDSAKAITGVSVSDSDDTQLTTTLSVLHGTTSVATGGGAIVSNNGTATVTISGTATQINNALVGLIYSSTADYNGNDTLTVSTTDTKATTVSTVGITVTPVQDAFNDSAATNEDTLVNINVNSNDSFENAGHTITAIDSAAITAGGAAVAVTNGTVALKLDGTLDFTPSANFNGSTSFSYTVTSGGVTETATVNVTVNPVNDAPSFTLASTTTTSNEDAGPRAVVGFASAISPGPANESGQTVSFVIDGNTNTNLFAAGGGPAIDASGNLTYTAAANANGTATITVHAMDNGGTANGGVNSSASQTFTITVNSVNDAPSGADNTITGGGQHIFVVSDFGFTDPNDNPANSLLAVEITTTPATGSLTNNGAPVAAGTFISVADITAGKLVYTPSGSAASSFTFQVQDNGGTANGGVDLDQSPNTITLVQNQPPVANDDATTAVEKGGTNNAAGGSDPTGNVILGTGGHGETADTDDQTPAPQLTVVAVHTGAEGSSGQTTGTVGAGLASASGYGTLTLSASGNYTYVVNQTNAAVQALNVGQSLTDTFNYTIQDGAGAQDTATITVTINGANDSPVVDATGTTAYTENQSATAIAPAVTVADVDSATLTGATVQITTGYANGQDILAFTNQNGITGTFAAGTGTLTLAGNATVAQYQAALRSVTYFNNSDNPSAASRTVAFQVNDGAAQNNLSAVSTHTVTVTPVNDPPIVGSFTSSGNEDADRTISLQAVDNDGTIQSYTVTTLPPSSVGTLYTNSAYTQAVVAGTPFTGSTLYFRPAANFSGTGTFQYTATDNSGATGGTAQVRLDVSPVADQAGTPAFGSFQPTPATAQANTATTPQATGGVNERVDQSAVSAVSGGYVVAFTSQDESKSNFPSEIDAQRYDVNGNAVGAAIRVTNSTDGNTNYDYNPDVQKLSNGGFVVTWDRQTSPTELYSDIQGRIYNASGTAVTGEFTIASGGTTRQLFVSSSVTLSDGSFVTVWADGQSRSNSAGEADLRTIDVYGQRTSATGTPIGGRFAVPTNTAEGQLHPKVAALSDGGFLVTWSTDTDSSANGDYEIHAQRYNSAAQAVNRGGTALGADEFTVSTNNSGANDLNARPTVAGLPNGGWVVAFESSGDVHARIFTAAGVGGSEITVNTTTAQGQDHPSVVTLPDGGFVVSYRSTGSALDILAQRFDAGGQKVGGEFSVSATASSEDQSNNALAVLSNGDVVSSWTDAGRAGKSAHSLVFDVSRDGGVGTATSLTTLNTAPSADTDGSETLSYHLTGYPSGTTFNYGSAVSPTEWVISSAADINALKTNKLTATVTTPGTFTLTIDARETDTATLSTGTVTSTSSSTTTLSVSIKSAADPVFAAHDSGPFALHLSAIADHDTAHVETLPDNGSLTHADGSPVALGATLSASELAGLVFTPTDTATDTASNFVYRVSDGTSVTPEILPIYVRHGSDLTLTGTAEKDVIVGGAGHDVLDGAGGGNFLTGGGGADSFVFGTKALQDASGPAKVIDHVTDYSAVQHDSLDFSALFGAVSDPLAHASSLVHATASADGSFASLAVNTAGPDAAPHWVEIAHLTGLHQGQAIDVVLDAKHPLATAQIHVDAWA